MRLLPLIGLLLTAVRIPAEAQPTGIEAGRAAKDSLFRYASSSPIPTSARAGFTGLAYFAIDPRFRVVGELQAYGRRQRLQVPATGGESISMERYGRFAAVWESQPFVLEVYRSLENGELVIMFSDATNGRQTYGGGRYVPVEMELGGMPVVDFNRAYQPYCAYNDAYSCPLPPAANRLSFAVLAGERTGGADLAHGSSGAPP